MNDVAWEVVIKDVFHSGSTQRTVSRLDVPGGWLYLTQYYRENAGQYMIATTFVPHPHPILPVEDKTSGERNKTGQDKAGSDLVL